VNRRKDAFREGITGISPKRVAARRGMVRVQKRAKPCLNPAFNPIFTPEQVEIIGVSRQIRAGAPTRSAVLVPIRIMKITGLAS
jgi:hypothetical protein